MCTKYNPLELGEYQRQQKTFTLVLYTCIRLLSCTSKFCYNVQHVHVCTKYTTELLIIIRSLQFNNVMIFLGNLFSMKQLNP